MACFLNSPHLNPVSPGLERRWKSSTKVGTWRVRWRWFCRNLSHAPRSSRPTLLLQDKTCQAVGPPSVKPSQVPHEAPCTLKHELDQELQALHCCTSRHVWAGGGGISQNCE